ncbi:MAG: hypothetical protein ACE5G2_00305 [Candidatus Krumholzibacteriia bacterium]
MKQMFRDLRWPAGVFLSAGALVAAGAAELAAEDSSATHLRSPRSVPPAAAAPLGIETMLTGRPALVDLLGADPLVPRLLVEGVSTRPGVAPAASASSSRSRYVLPVLLSAVVPGAGEIATGHWWNGLPLVAADVATWLGYAHFEAEGDRLRDEYQQFADRHWAFDRWQQKLEQHFHENSAGPFWWNEEAPHNCECSPPFIPPEEDLREYYENLGKYPHFWPGWEMWEYNAADPRSSDSPLRLQYVGMRIDSNGNYDNATRMLGVAALTRVASVIQSIYLVHRDARREGLVIEPVTFGGFGSGIRLKARF